MTYGGPRGVEYHSRSGEAHGLPHPFTHDRFVAVYGTFLARTLFLTERATVETGVCIAQQFFAVGAKNGILFFFSTVEAYHQLLCTGRNSSWFCDRSCVQKIPAEKVADISGCSCDYTSIYHNQFLYYGVFIWRNHFLRIHCSCAASGKNTSWNGRKLFCSSVYHGLH